jgi:hypothetical protein
VDPIQPALNVPTAVRPSGATDEMNQLLAEGMVAVGIGGYVSPLESDPFGIDAGAMVCFELQFRLRIVLRR